MLLLKPPNHPSYPAAHGCLSGAISAALAYLFPRDAAALNALGTEAGEVDNRRLKHFARRTISRRSVSLEMFALTTAILLSPGRKSAGHGMLRLALHQVNYGRSFRS
jgi:hypothetical protein